MRHKPRVFRARGAHRPRALSVARDNPFRLVRSEPSGALVSLNRMYSVRPDSPCRPRRHRRAPPSAGADRRSTAAPSMSARPPCAQFSLPSKPLSPDTGGFPAARRSACMSRLFAAATPLCKTAANAAVSPRLTLIKCRLRCRSARTARLRLSPRGHLRNILSRQLTKNCVARSSWSICRRSFMPCMRDWSSSELMKGPKRNTLSVNGL